jgi:hypothetical protein
MEHHAPEGPVSQNHDLPWMDLATSSNPEDRKAVTDALRALGWTATDFMALGPQRRVQIIVNREAPGPRTDPPVTVKAASAKAQLKKLLEERAEERKIFTRDDYSDVEGAVLWWILPVEQPPFVGMPGDPGFPEGVTHWTRLPPVPWDERLPPEERRP